MDAVLTSPPYPGVYDYLSFARKVRAGSGAAAEGGGRGGTSGASAAMCASMGKVGAAVASAVAAGAWGRPEGASEAAAAGMAAEAAVAAAAGVGAAATSAGAGAVVPGSDAYFQTAVPTDRHWPAQWLEGEIGGRRALRSNPLAFADTWQREQEVWVGVVAAALRPGGRAAVMVWRCDSPYQTHIESAWN